MDVEGPGDGADRLALADEFAGKVLLVGLHFLGSPEGYAARLRRPSAILGAAQDQAALELGDSAKDGHDHLPRGRGRIRPRLISNSKSSKFL